MNDAVTTMNVTRRNGKPRSCEPCRKTKARCDHTLPTCARCEARGTINECYYHPAPLTRPRPTSDAQAHSSPSKRVRQDAIPEEPIFPVSGSGDPQNSPIFAVQTRYMEPNEYASALPDDHGLFEESEKPLSDVAIEHSQNHILGPNSLRNEDVEATAQVIARYFRIMPFFETLIPRYYETSEVAIIPSPFVLLALPAVADSLKKIWSDDARQNLAAARRVLETTLTRVTVPPFIPASKFLSLFTGQNLRLECLGIIFSLAGLASFFLPAHDPVCSVQSYPDSDQGKFALEMADLSETCIELCQRSNTVSDLFTSLLYESLVLSALRHGDSSTSNASSNTVLLPNQVIGCDNERPDLAHLVLGHIVWRRLGDLCTEVIATGLHREPKIPLDMPRFLLEWRKRTFAAAYRIDKSISTFLGRPPRLCLRYCDCPLPLDLNDDQLMEDGMSFDLALASMDENGWSIDRTFRPSAWIRLRYIMAIYREEILEMSLSTSPSISEARIRDVSRRCQSAWQSLPPQLHYDPSCWSSGQSSSTCFIQLAVYLDYLHSQIQLQRLLERQTNSESLKLIETAAELFSSFLTLARRRDRTSDVNRDFSWSIFIYGLPSAGVLAKYLQRSARLDRPFPESLSRSEVVRNLSEFVSCLEWVAASGEGNYIACDRAAKILTGLLDEVLNGSWSGGKDISGPSSNAAHPPVTTDDAMSLMNDGGSMREPLPYTDGSYGSAEDLWGWFDGMNVDLTSILGEGHLSHTF